MDDDGSCRRKEADLKAYLSYINHQNALLQHHQVASGGGNSNFDITAAFPYVRHISPHFWDPTGGAGLLSQQQVSELTAMSASGLRLHQNLVPQRQVSDGTSGTLQRALAETNDKRRIVKTNYPGGITMENTVIGIGDYKKDVNLPMDGKTVSSVRSEELVRATEGVQDVGWCRSCRYRTGPCEAGSQNTCQVRVCSYVVSFS